ncbi:MAG TPA: MdtA/MuxA family multidrug efflux RND transporter periplasmic adaptor subunit [Zoogloea sp.]|uniref:MdtA/MuxA family multidrug efflux RND transporter periplasmic adaptor subunit n=1 Tax=Zoogloea sp. TaxID=49181 RepID=UPI002C330BF2|nr:MdtA/MuxA family multidrug efflux RND transporter periplasmic adaptor subunit [Zoogloea sp.]HMV18457.1 MdtA/MuxA family multidrug efflux RND transporter periplasmic adaptor subunit [Rhodocyclaceae bacterium]HMW50924.1 MdtA/MuxA family multidrug efflux RND transporter periplasmic adaptor subunit [Rhodocyclaceae bacterium]HMY49920.1 MdtA/MuxA family multidrug efflux RND transporter periplasmic adaptor subunit [Rhodocyclaceae bacterium]HMZ77081.1 MdtA/MuxA family multidrug efflux RND transporte
MSPTPSDVSPAASANQPVSPPRRRLWPWFLVLALALGGVYAWRTSMSESKVHAEDRGRNRGDRPQPVLLGEVQAGDIRVYVSALGSLVPRNQVTVRARVDGQLMKVVFREGQAVKAGDLLAEVDARPFEVAVAQAEGQLLRDKALLQNARIDLDRYKGLLAQDSIARQQVDTQEALVRQYEGTVKADQGAVDSARLQLSYTRITAPIAGRAGLRQVDPGNIVHASDTTGVVTLAQVSPITAVFAVPEERVAEVMARQKAGKPLAVEAWDREQRTLLATGRLIAADSQIDTTTGTLKLKAEFANEDGSLFPNQFVNVRLILDRLKAVPVLPTAALMQGDKGRYVYRVGADNTVAAVTVRLGAVDGERIAVEGGLDLGDKVVVDGLDKLRDGAAVEAIAPDAANAPGRKRPPKGGPGGGGPGGGRPAH